MTPCGSFFLLGLLQGDKKHCAEDKIKNDEIKIIKKNFFC